MPASEAALGFLLLGGPPVEAEGLPTAAHLARVSLRHLLDIDVNSGTDNRPISTGFVVAPLGTSLLIFWVIAHLA